MSLKKIAETLENQRDQIEEISVRLFDTIERLFIDTDKIASRTMHSSILLGSIEKSNRGILSAIRKLNKSDSDKKGDNLEKQREEKSYNERLLKAISGVEQNTKGKGSTSGGKKGGLGIGAGAGLGLAALKGAGVVTGLAALGFGIGGFFSGLALAGSVSDMLGVNMNAVKSQMVTLGEAFSETPTDGLLKMGALLAAGGAFGALFGAKTSGKAAAGMTAIGLGIGGFFAGLAASDGLSTLMNADGSMIKAQMVNLAEGLGAFSEGQLKGLSALLGVGALFGAVPGGVAGLVGAAVGMSLVGAGIGGFFAALSLADKGMEMFGGDGSAVRTIMENTAAGLSSFNDVSPGKLIQLAGALPTFGLGFAALMAEEAIGSVFKFVSKLFSSGDEKSIFEKTADGLKSFDDVDIEKLNKMGNLSSIFDNLGSSLERLSDVDFKKIKTSMQDLGSVVSSNSSLFADENAIAVAYKINPTKAAMLKESTDTNNQLMQQNSSNSAIFAPVSNSSNSNTSNTNLVSGTITSHDFNDPFLGTI